ncbi:MAG: DNA polymerase III subunit delta' [Peptococcaceae bacterium]|jgi:DNA polymerase-3 subunit delta'|nr:DNA polymerase III subunit delta' [Peptococcaceae bacterium]MDH7525176.1 DNA polymerase III subunit delta' [Peptococcaceae bacterium]
MGFERLKGQARAVSILQAALKSKRVSHAYLFQGPGGVGKNLAASLFAQALNCETPSGENPCENCAACRKIKAGSHPDILRILPDGASLKIAQIRTMQEKAYFKCYEGKFKVIMIDDVHLLTTEAANCLLKILEDPPERTVFILLAEDAGKLPLTILSRSQAVPFGPLDDGLIHELLAERGIKTVIPPGLSRGSAGKAFEIAQKLNRQEFMGIMAELFEDMRSGGYQEACSWAEKLEKDRELMELVLEFIALYYRDTIVKRVTGEAAGTLDLIAAGNCSLKSCYRALEELDKAGSRLSSNANTRLVLEILFFNLRNIEREKTKRKEGVPQW